MQSAGTPRALWHYLAGATVLGMIIGVALILGIRRDRSTWDAYTSIREGMGESEVESLLGGPPADRSTGPTDFCVAMTADEQEAFRSELVTKEWVNDDALISVGFDRHGRVVRKFCTANRAGQPTWLQRVRAWLRI
jgi:hypothetical protein